MSGNSIGSIFKLSSFGESHGLAIGGIVDGCPSNIELNEADLQHDLDRRKPGKSRHTTPRQESDQVKILSGTFENKTTGTPIAFIIYNQDQRSKDYNDIKDIFRPSHADYTYQKKYHIRDYRGGGRSSARETAVRVAAGGIAKKILQKYGIEIRAYISQIGNIKTTFDDWKYTNNNDFFCPNETQIDEITQMLDNIRKEGDSIGAKVSLHISNVVAGLGEPVYNRLDAALSFAMMSINASKSVSIGNGNNACEMLGSEFRDEMRGNGENETLFLSNNSGGILGGISTGQDIVVHTIFKPTASIRKEGLSVNTNNENITINIKGRHDPCVGIRAVPIVEAMAAITIVDFLMLDKAKQI